MNRLVLFEGLPGSGKTTLSARFADRLRQEGASVQSWREGELHPADLSWCACVPDAEWETLLRRYPEYQALLGQNAEAFCGHNIVAYTQLGLGPDDVALENELSRYEVYDGRVTSDLFASLHRSRWQRFAQQAVASGMVSVFECVLLQNRVNEWLLFHDADEERIFSEIEALLKPTLPLRPLLIHLQQPDIADALRHTGAQRPGWLEYMMLYIEKSPYGKKNDLRGEDGLVEYFSRRQAMEERIVRRLPCETLLLSLADGWDELLEKCVAAWHTQVSPSPQR